MSETPPVRKEMSVTHHPPSFGPAQRWILAAALSGIGWTLLIVDTTMDPPLPLAIWGLFMWVAASNVVAWATIEHVMRRERMKVEHLAEVIAEAMAHEGHVQRLPKQHR